MGMKLNLRLVLLFILDSIEPISVMLRSYSASLIWVNVKIKTSNYITIGLSSDKTNSIGILYNIILGNSCLKFMQFIII